MQGDSVTTVSISFTTRYFNFEKILLQDFWELLKPFNVEHFGESAEFYVCFSDTKSLVAAYQALNKRPVGKYFTLNMELTDAQRALLPRNPNDASKTSEGRDVVTDGDFEILEVVEFEEDKTDSDSAEYEYIEVDADAVLDDDEEVQYLVLADDGNFHEVDIATYRASQKIAASEREEDSESSEAKTEKTSKVFVVMESGSSEEMKDEKKENKKEVKTKRVRNSSSSQDTDDDEVTSDSKSDLSLEPDKSELANAKPVRVESKHAPTYSSDTSRSNDSRKLSGKENKPSANEYRRERTPERHGKSRRDEKRGDTNSRRYEASPKRYDRYDRPKERDRGRRYSPERSGRGHFDDRRRERSFSSDSFEDDRRKKYGKSKNEQSYSRSRTKESTRGKGSRSFSESPSRNNNGKRSNTRRKDERSDSRERDRAKDRDRERDRAKDRDRERDRAPKKSGRDRSRSRSKSPKPKRREEVDDRRGKKDERRKGEKVDNNNLPADSHQERKQPVPSKETNSTRGQGAKSETASSTSKAKPLSPRKQPSAGPSVPKPATPNPSSTTLSATQLFASVPVQEKQPQSPHSTTADARPPSQASSQSQPQPQPQAVKPAVTKPEDNSATPEWVNVDAHLPGPTMTDGADSSDGKEIPVEMMPEGKNWRKMLEQFCAQRGKSPPKFVKIQNKTNNMWSCKVITYKSDYVAGGEFSYRRQAVQVSSQVAYNKLLTHEQLMTPSPLGRGKPNNGRGGKGSPNGRRPNPSAAGNANSKPRW